MLNMLKFLFASNITRVALFRYVMIAYLIQMIKTYYICKYELDINGNQYSEKAIDVRVNSKSAHVLNAIYLISQIILALM